MCVKYLHLINSVRNHTHFCAKGPVVHFINIKYEIKTKNTKIVDSFECFHNMVIKKRRSQHYVLLMWLKLCIFIGVYYYFFFRSWLYILMSVSMLDGKIYSLVIYELKRVLVAVLKVIGGVCLYSMMMLKDANIFVVLDH